jgi:hypothetical protein
VTAPVLNDEPKVCAVQQAVDDLEKIILTGLTDIRPHNAAKAPSVAGKGLRVLLRAYCDWNHKSEFGVR